ncbi:MAG: OmpA family protein, partial [Bacteroidia bacterium]|nr:OmpA family protein [Bacteroidia bacterium]
AESVKNYLVLNGISVDRIQATGYGQNTPVATNTTPEGRALNRRVEFRVIRKQTMASIQDFIYLRTGEIMGVRVISVNENEVRYRTFHDDTEYTVSSSSVIKVVYASGDSWYSPKPEAVVTANSKPKANSELVATLKWFGRFFTGVPGYYGKHASLFSAQYEYRDNLIGGMKYDSMIYIQPVAIGYERQLYRNFGLGVNASLHMWGAPEQELRYTYGALTARLLYHPYVAKRIDPYVGIAGTLRAIQLNQPEWPAKRWVNVSYDWVAGCRFFPARRMGIFGEIGSDGIAKYSAGLILVFGQLSEDW